MSHQSHEIDIRKHVRIYLMVFGALWVLTLVTVAISYIHLSFWPSVLLALFVATVKGSLVACFFMHLISEQKLIFWILIFTVIFFLGLLLLPYFGVLDQVRDTARLI